MVVCAPTGSGKTVIFELAMIRMLIKGNPEDQAVYMAPSKALVAERVRDWTRRFAPLGITVAELTGDTHFRDVKAAKSARVLVTTPDKWDATTRRFLQQQKLQSRVRLVMIDEVHMLRDARGPRLEAVVARVKVHGNSVRIIALSATVPNVQDVADWIGNDNSQAHTSSKLSAQVFRFGEEYRPVPLKRFVYGYGKHEVAGYSNALDKKLLALIKDHGKGKPVLIFVPTRNATIQSADHLAKEYSSLRSGPMRPPWPIPKAINASFDHLKLSTVAKQGIAFHHAGLSLRDRKTIEEMFLDGRLSVLCCTSTLAVGTNLPAHCVIVRGTQIFDETWKEMSELDLIQMLGRAGRPEFDNEGCAVIMCDSQLKEKYSNLASGDTTIESHLGEELKEHLNSEIGLHGFSTSDALLRWIKATFYYVRLRKNPERYGHKALDETFDCDKHLYKICSEALTSLKESTLVSISNENDQIHATEFGDIMAKHFVSYNSMLSLMKQSEHPISTKEVLERISEAEEFKTLRPRRGDKDFYAALMAHDDIRYPPAKVSGAPEKVSLLIQVVLAGIATSELKQPQQSNPVLDSRTIFRVAPRLSLAALDIALARKDGHFTAAAFEVMRAMHGQAWDTSPSVLRQLDGIGEKSMRVLSMSGISSIRDVATSDPRRLEQLLSRHPPFGNKLVANAKQFPAITLGLHQVGKARGSSGLSVTMVVEVGLEICDAILSKRTDDGTISFAAILTMTSDKQLVDFRRTPIKVLARASPQTFTVKCPLTKPSQRIICVAACDNIAGTALKAELRPDADPAEYPVPELDKEAGETVLEQVQNSEIQSEPVACGRARSYVEIHPHDCPDAQQNKLADRRCKHTCRRPCKHACCNEGVKKRTTAAKQYVFKATTPNDGPDHSSSMSMTVKEKPSKAKQRKFTHKPSAEKRKAGYLSDDTSDDDLHAGPLSKIKLHKTIESKKAAINNAFSDSEDEFNDPSFDEILSNVEVEKQATTTNNITTTTANNQVPNQNKKVSRRASSLFNQLDDSDWPSKPKLHRSSEASGLSTATYVQGLQKNHLPAIHTLNSTAAGKSIDPLQDAEEDQLDRDDDIDEHYPAFADGVHPQATISFVRGADEDVDAEVDPAHHRTDEPQAAVQALDPMCESISSFPGDIGASLSRGQKAVDNDDREEEEMKFGEFIEGWGEDSTVAGPDDLPTKAAQLDDQVMSFEDDQCSNIGDSGSQEASRMRCVAFDTLDTIEEISEPVVPASERATSAAPAHQSQAALILESSTSAATRGQPDIPSASSVAACQTKGKRTRSSDKLSTAKQQQHQQKQPGTNDVSGGHVSASSDAMGQEDGALLMDELDAWLESNEAEKMADAIASER
ncbi:P-loop containing nucleoside triphosphate hydrolase protein [Tilletiaria anomala UBC 951]|uniref:DNA 3'-5' helicase n=1 Tax=Tilletiaria anomala (strain ATCC 24038 / CBS 436.72 / UBC 951) TaxID=1037660 RepID=A0A066VNF2_TILAU|nr:P-loop containing nucleoside triphosphate hydrolase protein [Tilletiaria anomala UBC 951]KDN42996.1 P-loop containing nucleoside triphosphate hydrolase protein [Tilletiaria anomala UBC 951]